MRAVERPLFSAAQPVVLGFSLALMVWGYGGGGGGEGSKEARIQGPTERRDSAAGHQTALGESNRAIEGGE